MKILFCYAVILVVACATTFLIASVLWRWAVDISPFDDEDDEEIPYDPDRERDWDIADEMGAL